MMTELAEKLFVIHDAFVAAGIPHAVGGAIAFGYCAAEPRGTRDIDINVFVDSSGVDDVFAALPVGVAFSDADREQVLRDDQVRLFWDGVPVDLFFVAHDFHRHVALGVRDVPFEGGQIPVIDCEALGVFKVLFNRTRDWGDLEAMVESGSLDNTDVLVWLGELIGDDDPLTQRLRGLLEAPR